MSDMNQDDMKKYFEDQGMTVLGADTPEDIDRWPSFDSLFSGKEEKKMKSLDRILLQSYFDELLDGTMLDDIKIEYKGNYRIVTAELRTIANEGRNVPDGFLCRLEFKTWSTR